jgi:autotransporter-associated beta strand protein
MKNKLNTLKHLLVLGGFIATTTVHAQVVRTFTNTISTDIGLSSSWTPNGAPSGATQDTAQWDGIVPGNLSLVYTTGWGNSGFGTSGVNLVLTTNQTGNVTISGPAAGSPAFGVFGITNNSPSGVLRIGNAGSANLLNPATRPGTAGTVHGFVNNSTSPAIFDSSMAWVAGGGVACVMDFGGTGDWIVNHVCRFNNSGAGPLTVTLEGPGSMTWSNGGTFLSSTPLGYIRINGGTMILKGAGLAQNFTGVPAGNNTITNNGVLLKYDAAAADTIARTISGSGSLQVNNGTLTLSGANTYTNTTTLSGGELIVGVAENFGTSGPLGVGGTISFTGGTLGFNAANTFDYSPRFSSAAGQLFKFDTHGLGVLLTNNIASSGGSLTKLGSGTLTLSGANTYNGLTAVGAGKLVLQNTDSSSVIVVSNSTTLGVSQGGIQIAPSILRVGTTSSSTLEFNGVSSTTTAAIAAGSIAVGGPITINVNSGSLTIGQSYPLISWSSGSAPGVVLGTLTGAVGNLTTNGSTIKLNITGLANVWSGATDGNWDLTTSNWKINGSPAPFANGSSALFDDTATGQTNVTLTVPITPGSVTVNSSAKIYSITSSGANLIGGSGGLTKNGTTILTLAGGVNTFSGATTISGGTVSVGALADGGSASDIGSASSSAANLVLNGGTLQYTGGAQAINRLCTLGTGNGAIDASGSGALTLNNSGSVALSGSGARTLTLKGSSADDNTLAAVLADNGGATSLIKTGAGKWIVTGNNANSGTTTIDLGGTLQVGNGGATGSLGSGTVVDNGSLIFNVTGTLTNNTISGGSAGSVTLNGPGKIVLPGNNTYSGGTTINAGTLQIGVGGATGTIDSSDPVVNNGTLIVDSTGDLTLSGAITGTGDLIKRGSGLLKLLGTGTSYSGNTTIDTGARLQIWQGNTGANASPYMTNNGTLIMMRQDNGVAIYAGNISGTGKVRVEVSNGNNGDSTLTGSNTYTGGTFVLGGGLILGDGGTPGAGSILGDVALTNDFAHNTFGTAPNDFVPATLTFNRPDDFTFPGNIFGNGFVVFNGSATVTLTGNNTYTNTGTGASTTINAGKVVVGNGGTTGSIGTGAIVNNSELVFNRSDALSINRAISGGGSLVKAGAGVLTLSANNTYVGITTVSNGTLVVNGANASSSTYVAIGTLGGTGTFAGPVTTDPGTTLAPGAFVGTLTVNSDLTIGGNIAVEVNKSLAQSNDLVVVTGVLTNIGTGTLTVSNLGSALVAGDTFTLFSQPLGNGGALTIAGPSGVTFTNKLAVDGSITVLSVPVTVNTNRPVVSVTVSGGTMNLAWPTNLGWRLQTNSVGLSATGSWFDYPGSTTLTNVSILINQARPQVFFRMVYP